MLPKHISAIFLSLAAFSLVSTQRCSRTVVRKEIRDVNVNERKAYFRAFRALGGSRSSFLERQTKVHVDNQLTIHGYPVFLVWHRTFTWLFENALRKVDASVAAHYWDWTKDARSPERSVLFTNDYIGYSNYGSCLNSPNFPRWNTNYPSPHCVSRSFVNGDSPGAFYPRAITDEIRYQSRSYDYYRIRLEGGPHAAPHNGCGGDMSNMQSPSDPMFYLHHSFIDKLFAEWQHDSASRVRMYDGWNYDNSPARLSDQLVGLGRRVQDVLDIRSLCYDYQQTRNPNDYGTVYDLPMLLATPPDAGAQNQGSFGVQNDWNSNNQGWNNGNQGWNDNSNQGWNNGNQGWTDNSNQGWNNNNNNWNNGNQGWTDNSNQGWNNGNQGWTDNSNQGWTDNSNQGWTDNSNQGWGTTTSNNGWGNNNGGWLQRRSFSATRPSPAAQPQPAAVEPQAQVAPRPSMPAPAAEPVYTPPVPKAAALTFTADIPEERVNCHAGKYNEEMAHPRPIDEEWLKMNNICPETQRALESMYCEIINKVNVVIKSKACPEEKK